MKASEALATLQADMAAFVSKQELQTKVMNNLPADIEFKSFRPGSGYKADGLLSAEIPTLKEAHEYLERFNLLDLVLVRSACTSFIPEKFCKEEDLDVALSIGNTIVNVSPFGKGIRVRVAAWADVGGAVVKIEVELTGHNMSYEKKEIRDVRTQRILKVEWALNHPPVTEYSNRVYWSPAERNDAPEYTYYKSFR